MDPVRDIKKKPSVRSLQQLAFNRLLHRIGPTAAQDWAYCRSGLGLLSLRIGPTVAQDWAYCCAGLGLLLLRIGPIIAQNWAYCRSGLLLAYCRAGLGLYFSSIVKLPSIVQQAGEMNEGRRHV